ncbi:MAG: histidine kinase, partial [Sulfurimonas sp.]
MYYVVIGSIPEYMKHLNSEFWLYPIFISLTIAFFITGISFFKSWKKEVLEKEKLKNEMLTYKYEALRNQINPHFMFNSLNVLSDLVYEDPKKAERFIHKFSDIYRYVLDSREKELVPLEEELNFINKYIF